MIQISIDLWTKPPQAYINMKQKLRLPSATQLQWYKSFVNQRPGIQMLNFKLMYLEEKEEIFHVMVDRDSLYLMRFLYRHVCVGNYRLQLPATLTFLNSWSFVTNTRQHLQWMLMLIISEKDSSCRSLRHCRVLAMTECWLRSLLTIRVTLKYRFDGFAIVICQKLRNESCHKFFQI